MTANLTPRGLAEEVKAKHAQKFKAEAQGKGAALLGIELEFPMVSSDSNRFGHALRLSEVKEVFRHIGAKPSWELTAQGLDAEIRMGGGVATINAEAGFSTLEIALPPASSIRHAGVMIENLVVTTLEAAQANNAYVLGYGVHPINPPSLDLYCPRDRSNTMRFLRQRLTNIQDDNSDLGNTISASVQFHVEVKNPDHAITVLNVFNGLAPEFIALSANSRISRGTDTGEFDIRNRFYEKYTRYPIVGGVAPKMHDFDDYLNILGSMPVLLLKRGANYVAVLEEITLAQFIERGKTTAVIAGQNKPFEVHFEIGDLDVAESMVRWEARAKATTGTVELRTCSMQQSKSDILALGSAVLGLSVNLNRAAALIADRTREDAQYAKEEISKYGMAGYPSVQASAKAMLDIAKEGLESIGEDTKYLQILYDRLRDATTPSEKSFEIYQKEGIRPFIESLRFQLD